MATSSSWDAATGPPRQAARGTTHHHGSNMVAMLERLRYVLYNTRRARPTPPQSRTFATSTSSTTLLSCARASSAPSSTVHQHHPALRYSRTTPKEADRPRRRVVSVLYSIMSAHATNTQTRCVRLLQGRRAAQNGGQLASRPPKKAPGGHTLHR